jgi:hypothetical protein
MNTPRSYRVQAALMSLEAAAVSARGGFACMFSTSDEYEIALITDRRAQGRYGRPARRCPVAMFVGCALLVLPPPPSNGLYQIAGNIADAVGIDADLPALRSSGNRDHADRRLPVLLRLQGLRRTAETQARRLLRVLLLRLGTVSADTGGEMLRLALAVLNRPSRPLQSRGRVGYRRAFSTRGGNSP